MKFNVERGVVEFDTTGADVDITDGGVSEVEWERLGRGLKESKV